METVVTPVTNVTKSNLILRLALAGAFGLLSATTSFADSKLNELKKRKMELDQAAAKCEAMDEPDKSDCMAKRQKKVDKYREELESYKADLAKEQSNAAKRQATEKPADFNTKIQNREQSIKEFQDY